MPSAPTALPSSLAGLVAALGLGAGAGATAYAVLTDDAQHVVREVTVSDSRADGRGTGLSISEIYERVAGGASSRSPRRHGSRPAPFGGEPARGPGLGLRLRPDQATSSRTSTSSRARGRISVRFSDGSTHAAELVGTDPSTDLAVIKVDAPARPARAASLWPTPSELEVGDAVVAMGSPFGLEGTVTSGIVSALHRQMTAPNNFTINDSIQTDAAINHGNSGGPLLDLARSGDRRQRADRERVRRLRRRRLRDPVQHRALDRDPAHRERARPSTRTSGSRCSPSPTASP